MKYQAQYVPTKFFQDVEASYKEFELPTDEEAIWYAENPESHAMPIRFVSGEGKSPARIQKLIELTEPPRVVKEW